MRHSRDVGLVVVSLPAVISPLEVVMTSNVPLPVLPPKRTGYSRYIARICAVTSLLVYAGEKVVSLKKLHMEAG